MSRGKNGFGIDGVRQSGNPQLAATRLRTLCYNLGQCVTVDSSRDVRMKIRWADMIAPGLVAAVFTVLLVQWLGTGPRSDLQARVPGLDQSSAAAGPVEPQLPPVAGAPQRSGGQPADIAGSWPWFRGPDLDGVCRDTTPLARQWPPAGPPPIVVDRIGRRLRQRGH